MTRTIAALAAVALSALGAVAAQAETLSLSTAGYDLNTQAGAKAFYRHLSQSVSAACGGAPTNFFTSEEERFQACYKDTMKAAVEQTRAPLVAALAGQVQTRVASR
ncbi:MAG TPA: UrcA family protein [Caulobacteraceae bacterium]|jgi:UrcA family protein